MFVSPRRNAISRFRPLILGAFETAKTAANFDDNSKIELVTDFAYDFKNDVKKPSSFDMGTGSFALRVRKSVQRKGRNFTS